MFLLILDINMKLGSNFDHDITLLFCNIDDFCNEYENDLGQELIGNIPLTNQFTAFLIWNLSLILDRKSGNIFGSFS